MQMILAINPNNIIMEVEIDIMYFIALHLFNKFICGNIGKRNESNTQSSISNYYY